MMSEAVTVPPGLLIRTTRALTFSSFEARVNSSLNVASRLGWGTNPSLSCVLISPEKSSNNTLPSPVPLNCTSWTGPGGSIRLIVIQPAWNPIKLTALSTRSTEVTLCISLLHHLNKFAEQIGGIMRTRGRFRMILYRKDRTIQANQPLDGLIVETQMCNRNLAECGSYDWRSFRYCGDWVWHLYSKIMILGCNFDFPRPEIEYGMIRSMMAKLQLVALES